MGSTEATSRTELPIITVSSLGDGTFLEWSPNIDRKEKERIRLSMAKTVEGDIGKWQRVIKEVMKHKKSCIVRLITSIDIWGNITYNEITIRVKE